MNNYYITVKLNNGSIMPMKIKAESESKAITKLKKEYKNIDSIISISNKSGMARNKVDLFSRNSDVIRSRVHIKPSRKTVVFA